MRRYVGLYIFCAVLTFAFSGASLAEDGAAEYRAPVSGVKLGPVKPAQPVAPEPSAPVAPAAQNQAEQRTAPSQPAVSGQPTPWPGTGGMAPYSSFGALPESSAPADPAAPPASTAPNPAAMPGASAAPSAAGQVPGYAPYPPPVPGQGWQGQQGDVLTGTGQMENNSDNDRGVATQYRDPQTGDIITSVIPPRPPEQQDYGTFFVAPQIYPNGGGQWGGNPYGSMPRPGQPSWPGQQYMPPVIWQPGPQPGNTRHRHDDRRHDGRHDNRGYDGRHQDGPRYGSHGGGYSAPDRNRDNDRDRRDDDRYNPRPRQ